jgi:hypothetical protein
MLYSLNYSTILYYKSLAQIIIEYYFSVEYKIPRKLLTYFN